MGNCNHVWVLNEKGTKERCTLCKAARPIDSSRCNHIWGRQGNQTKERCLVCGAARAIRLHVNDMVTQVALTEPIPPDTIAVAESPGELIEVKSKGKKKSKSILKRIFSIRPDVE